MHMISKWVVAAAILLTIGVQRDAQAGFIGAPMTMNGAIHAIKLEATTLPPFAFTMFCLKYPGECKPQPMVFRGGALNLTAERWTDLKEVNQTVNAQIRPKANLEGLAGEKWLINPVSGDCNDYAVSKRHELIARGWPARTVLLSEVIVGSGEHHLVAVVRTDGGDLVLDNLTPSILQWSRTPYRWVRIQTPNNPNYWASLPDRNT